ncbi:MAG: hypothetical protein E7492_01240 [Ruminococcaceae bacterium]|nr:hypothetical protein [Oscillospiraceae bacterium]
MSEKLQNSNPSATKNKYTWIYLLIPILLVSFVGFKYIKGIIAEKRAEKAILAYVEETYGDELDKFEYVIGDTVSIHVGDTASIFGISSKTTDYYLSFHQQELWYGSFEIKADFDNNIVYDGYKNWYLLGGTVLQHNNSVYADTGYAIQKPLANKAMAENICTSADQLSVSPSLHYKTGTAEGGFGSVLIEPQLDPQKEYSLDRLAKDYGEIFITLKADDISEDAFGRYANLCAQHLKNSDSVYNNAVICLAPNKTSDTLYLAVKLTAEEINSGDIQQLIAEKAFEYTQTDRDNDVEVINSGADWPETYRYLFVSRVS